MKNATRIVRSVFVGAIRVPACGGTAEPNQVPAIVRDVRSGQVRAFWCGVSEGPEASGAFNNCWSPGNPEPEGVGAARSGRHTGARATAARPGDGAIENGWLRCPPHAWDFHVFTRVREMARLGPVPAGDLPKPTKTTLQPNLKGEIMMRTVTLAMVVALWACGESNEPPTVIGTIADQELFLGASVLIDLDSIFDDPEDDAPMYAATSSAAVAMTELAGSDLRVTGREKGTATVTVSATDAEGASAETSFDVTVPNRPPETVGSIPDQEMHRNETVMIELNMVFDDPDGDALEYEATTATGVAMTEVTGTVLSVSVEALGMDQVAVSASDPEGEMAHTSFEVIVSNREPEVTRTIQTQNLIVGAMKDVGDMNDYFRDGDGDDLTFSVLSSDTSILHAFISVEEILGLRGASVGTVTVTVTATDGMGEASQEFAASARAPLSWRDDFDRDEIGRDWEEQQDDGDASIVDDWLRTELDGGEYWIKASPFELENGWTILTSFTSGDGDTDACSMIRATLEHGRFSSWQMDVDWDYNEWTIYMNDDPTAGWLRLWREDFEYEPGSVVEMGWWLEGDSMHVSLDGDTVASFDPVEDGAQWPDNTLLPTSFNGVGLGVIACSDETGAAEFDWVEVREKREH